MLKAIDVDGDGEITKDEFIKSALSCEFIHDMLIVGMDPYKCNQYFFIQFIKGTQQLIFVLSYPEKFWSLINVRPRSFNVLVID